MKIIKQAACVAVAFSLGLGAASAHAANINWTLHDVVFDDGGVATGTFSTDSTTGDVTAFDVVTTTGTTMSAFTYDSGTSFLYANNYWAPFSFILADFAVDRYLEFQFTHTLSNSSLNALVVGPPTSNGYTAGPVHYGFNGSWDCGNCTPIRSAVSGFAAAPEPGAWALMIVGFAGLGGALRFSRRQAVAA
jgi:hypothetical protein